MASKEEQLSPLGNYEEGMNWNPVEKVILERRSIRLFKKEPLPDNMIRRILEAGRFAPSAGNCQPWKFVVVKSPEIIAEMEKDAVKFAKKLMTLLDFTRSRVKRFFTRLFSKMIIWFQANNLAPQPFGAIQQIAAEKVPVFYNAPVLILLLTDKRGVSKPELDIGVAGQNMVLTAHSMGAGACWIGMVNLIMHPLNMFTARKWKKFFGIKYPYELTDLIALGWPKKRFDGMVPREIQLVDWYEGGLGDPPRTERQGE
ncbi:MAG: nitroreductase family protein [Candidatus Hodarchaeota archaeon]